MTNTMKFLTRLGHEIMYFKNDFEQAVVKSVPKDGHYVKLKGQAEFKAKPESKLVADSLNSHYEITEKEYEYFI